MIPFEHSTLNCILIFATSVPIKKLRYSDRFALENLVFEFGMSLLPLRTVFRENERSKLLPVTRNFYKHKAASFDNCSKFVCFRLDFSSHVAYISMLRTTHGRKGFRKV